MKKLFVLLLCLPAMAFCQSNTYIIQGKVGGYISPAKVYLVFINPGKRIVDSALVDKGQFEFSGVADFTLKGYLFLNAKGDGPYGSDISTNNRLT